MTPTSTEALRVEFRRYRRLLELALAQVSDEDFFQVEDSDGNSMAIIVQHLAGNLRSRFTDFLTSDGEKSWRHRDAEFEAPSVDRAELIRRMEEGWAILDRDLDEVGCDDALAQVVTIRRQPLTVMEALYRSLAHHAYHVGQVVLLARRAVGSEWVTLSVPKGGSAAYEAHPVLERSPDGALGIEKAPE